MYIKPSEGVGPNFQMRFVIYVSHNLFTICLFNLIFRLQVIWVPGFTSPSTRRSSTFGTACWPNASIEANGQSRLSSNSFRSKQKTLSSSTRASKNWISKFFMARLHKIFQLFLALMFSILMRIFLMKTQCISVHFYLGYLNNFGLAQPALKTRCVFRIHT